MGQTWFIKGVMNSLQPSTATPSASIAARRLAGCVEEKYCVIRVRRAGKTCDGGKDVERPSMMRRADWIIAGTTQIEFSKFDG